VLALSFESCLSLSKGVPVKNGLIAGTTDDMSIVTRHSTAEHVTGVSDKPMGGLTSVKIPQTHGVVPTGGQGEVVITGQAHLLDEVAMAGEHTARDCLHMCDNASLLGIDVQVPDKKRFITGDGDKKLVLITVTSCKGCYPVSMSFKRSAFN